MSIRFLDTIVSGAKVRAGCEEKNKEEEEEREKKARKERKMKIRKKLK